MTVSFEGNQLGIATIK